MKNNSIYLLLLAFMWAGFSSCKLTAPSFKTVNNIRFERLTTSGLKLGADAQFNNPNPLKCKVIDVQMNVVLDDKLIGILGEKADVVINKKKDFTIPLGVLIKPEGTILEDIKTFYKILTDRPARLYLVGSIKVKVLGITFNIPIQYRQNLKRSDFKN